MDSLNTLTITANSGTVVFSLENEGDLWFRPQWKQGGDKVVINLEADKLLSGGDEYQPGPSIILSWLDPEFEIDGLLGRTVYIPQSYDEEQQDHATDFYYGEHLDFDDVRIEFVARTDNCFRIRVTGRVLNVDAEVPGLMDIEIDAMVRYIDRNAPPIHEAPRTRMDLVHFTTRRIATGNAMANTMGFPSRFDYSLTASRSRCWRTMRVPS